MMAGPSASLASRASFFGTVLAQRTAASSYEQLDCYVRGYTHWFSSIILTPIGGSRRKERSPRFIAAECRVHCAPSNHIASMSFSAPAYRFLVYALGIGSRTVNHFSRSLWQVRMFPSRPTHRPQPAANSHSAGPGVLYSVDTRKRRLWPFRRKSSQKNKLSISTAEY